MMSKTITLNNGAEIPVLGFGTWCIDDDKVSSRDHIKENSELDFIISDEDMNSLKKLDFKDYGEYSYFPVFSGK